MRKSNDCARQPPNYPGNWPGRGEKIEIGDLARENAALKMALDERKQQAAAKAAPASQELIEARATIDGLRKRVRELEEKLVFERLHKPKTKAAKPAPDDPRIAM